MNFWKICITVTLSLSNKSEWKTITFEIYSIDDLGVKKIENGDIVKLKWNDFRVEFDRYRKCIRTKCNVKSRRKASKMFHSFARIMLRLK